MKNAKTIGLFAALAVITYVIGCSDVKFDHKPSDTCKNFKGTCEVDPGGFNKYSFSFQVGSVSILFVNDNSGSMYTEQRKMAERFPNLIDSISHLDWEIAITTTDIKKENGQLLSFPNGSDVLRPNTPNAIAKFRETIKWEETCESPHQTQCGLGSGDERAIYAVNRAIDRGHSQFFQKDHLAIVILSDEDERSNGGNLRGWPLEDYDRPETLVAKVRGQLGAGKTLSVHPIIIQSGDTACYKIQNSQDNSVQGHYGKTYELLANPSPELTSMGGIVPGHTGSICALDYGEQLGDIGSKIVVNSQMKKLPCHPETEEDLNVTFSPTPDSQVDYRVDENNFLIVDPTPPGTTVHISVNCPLSV